MGILGLGLLGTVGVDLYLKNQTGSSLLDRGMQRFGKSGKNKDSREKDTMTTYWNDRFTENKGDVISGAETEKCLALLQDRRVDEILPWYEQMDVTAGNSSTNIVRFPAAMQARQNRSNCACRAFSSIDGTNATAKARLSTARRKARMSDTAGTPKRPDHSRLMSNTANRAGFRRPRNWRTQAVFPEPVEPIAATICAAFTPDP
jgi:hypothetical protein